jgi:Autotransporter beta-domain
LIAACALAPTFAVAQGFSLVGANVQERANGVLALMGFTLTPDVTTGSISIQDESAANPDFRQTSLGGGFTMSKSFPLYLEGTVAYGRYDPTFVASDGQVERPIPVKWNSLSATGGVGWDFPLTAEWTLRPIFNFSFGRVSSDGAVAASIAESRGSAADFEFLANGTLRAVGLGGSLMLDYERYRPENEIDVELRYTNIYLQSYDSSEAVEGHASAQTLALWSRWRAPTGVILLERPLRYVLEYAYTRFLGDLEGVLGFDQLHSFGLGLELDSSKYDIIVTRTRLLVRYKVGDNAEGWALGLAVSF